MKQPRLFPLPPRIVDQVEARQRALNAASAKRIVDILEQQERGDRAPKARAVAA